MIIPVGRTDGFDSIFAESLCCPVCLSDLHYFSVTEKKANLVCDHCRSVYLVLDGAPYFRMEDENWKIKDDEIQGEVRFNVDTIPASVHEARHAFIDRNSEIFLKHHDIDLSGDRVLLVGASFPELIFLQPRCKAIAASDIVPDMVRLYTEESRRRGFRSTWACADGECLPFHAESFDTVVVRQALHHMVRYYSAIGEFFRVCRTGGRVLIMDEPFGPPDITAPPLRDLPDQFPLYGGWTMGGIRKALGISYPISEVQTGSGDDPSPFPEARREYLKPDETDAESFLADKYMTFSILQAVHAVRFHSGDFDLFWSGESASVDMSQTPPVFRPGPNPLANTDFPDRLIGTGWMSIAARKTSPTSAFRDRKPLRAIPLGEDLRIPAAELQRLEELHRLRKQLDFCEQDRQARLEVIERVGKQLIECQADRAAQVQLTRAHVKEFLIGKISPSLRKKIKDRLRKMLPDRLKK